MKKYDSYKDSGISWIGEIPDHWDQCRLKSYNSLKGRIGWNGLRSDEFLTEGYAYLVTGQDFSGRDIQWDKCYQIERPRYEEDPFIQLSNGDLLITKDGTIGKVATVRGLDKPACLNSGIFVMKQTADKFDQGYLFWLLSSDLLKEFNNYTSSGTTILHLYQNVFENMPMIIPPKDEQKAIATYLDGKCSEVDKIIALQEKKMQLLSELRQNVIHKAVTKGIDSNSAMQPSGVFWIGDTPSHWNVKRVKFTGRARNGLTYSPADICNEGEGILVLRSSNIQDNKLCFEDNVYVSKYDPKLNVQPGDTIICSRNGSISLVGKAAFVESEISASFGAFMLRYRSALVPKYAYYMVSAAIAQYKALYSTTTVNQLTLGIFSDMMVSVPPNEEQEKILDYLDNEIGDIDNRIAKVQKHIDLLQNYKQSLITEVVTGKRKVC